MNNRSNAKDRRKTNNMNIVIVHHSTMWAFQLSNFTMEWGDMWNNYRQKKLNINGPNRCRKLLSVQDPNYIGGT